MTEKIRAVLENARECQNHKRVDRDRIKLMSR